FNSLKEEQILGIVRVQLKTVADRLKNKKINLEFTEPAMAHLAKIGYDPIYGARPLKRVIQTEVLNPLAKEMISGKYKSGDHVKVDYKKNNLVFT
ncbi:MAG: type VI secretion system ATPase TssH, partial [Bdellovibrionales bacterium]|nr:type VI secretion system ATPase TssH [Bdellovibrionales bacterium]